MNEIQLRMETRKVSMMADAIERDLKGSKQNPDHEELAKILTWLRYRTAKAAITPTTTLKK